MKRFVYKLRVFVLKTILTKDEKYLLARAIEERSSNLESLLVKSKSLDRDLIEDDSKEYRTLAKIFSTKDYRLI